MFKEEKSNGSATAASYKRTYSWNEKNQLISSVDANYSTSYVYGQDGQRSNKYTQNSETLYFNKMWTLHTDSGNNIYGGQTAKNIYLGETRIVTKLNSGENPTYQEEYYKQYFYHSDHLGSASLISDYKGDEYQRIEYTPYGETWVEKTQNTGLEFLPYKFTGKELDEETGLYYYGARYLDPKYSMWISTDPALGDYIPKAPINEEAKKHNQNLPGMGGVFNHINGDLYAYAGNNPVKYTDPDGNEQTPFQKALTAELSKLSKLDNGFIKGGVKIIIQRSWNDNGENGTYYQSKMSITYNGASLNEVSVQSTPDWQNELKRGNGERIPSGEYTGVLQKRSGKYANAINLQASFIKAKDIFIHPNVMTALGETEPYGQGKQKGKPFSLGCQITNLSDFNELTDILNALGFDYGEGEWGTGDSVRVEIKPAKNWAMMENQ